MAIPTNYIDKITKDGESRDICPAADKVRVNNDNFDGENLDEVLDEMKDAIDDAASQGGIQTETDPTVPSHVKNITQQNITDWNNKYTKPNTGIPASDLASGVIPDISGLATKTDLNQKANSSEVIKGVSVNGTPQTKDPNTGVVNIDAAKSVTINGNTTQVDNNGNVNLGSVQGEKGDKGDTGNVQVDGNGNVLIYNGRDKTTTGAALDASQGQFLEKLFNVKDNTFYNVWVGTANDLEQLGDNYEDNTIYLVGTIPTVVQRFNVSFNGGDHTSIPANTPQTVKEGSSFSVVVSPASGYTIDTATGSMEGGGALVKTENQDGTVTFSTTSVTGAISIQAAATKHITGITVTAGTRDGNSIPLTAAVSPTGADNVTLAWSISEDGTNYSNSTTHFGINSNGVLTIKEGADNSSVTVKCADTNVASDSTSGTLQLTGITYEETPATAITDISATRTAPNTLTLSATANGSLPSAISYAIVGTTPTVDHVVRTTTTEEVEVEQQEVTTTTVETLPAVVLNNGVLTYKGDCSVQIKAIAGNLEKTKTINIVHDTDDKIWFEDDVVKGILIEKGYGSNGEITYAEALVSHGTQTTQSAYFKNNTEIKRFKEWQYFTTSVFFSVEGCTNLDAVILPKLTSESTFDSRFGIKNTALTEIDIPNGYTVYGRASGAFIDNPIQGASIIRIGIPSSLTTISSRFNGLGIEVMDLSETNITSITSTYTFYTMSKLRTVLLPDVLNTISGALFRECTKLTRVEFGAGWTGYSGTLYYDGAFAEAKAMTYVFRSTTPPTAVNFNSNQNNKRTVDKILVPRSAVDTYKASEVFANYVDKISAIEDEEE